MLSGYICDHCAHEGVCVFESTLRNYAREVEIPSGPFRVDIVCTRRMLPSISAKESLAAGASDEFIISKVWPDIDNGRCPGKERK